MSSPQVNCRRLEGKVAVITASTEGIGFAIAERFAQEGAKVAISSRKQANVDKAADSLKSKGYDVIGVKCHVSNAEDRKRLFEETANTFGGIDILVSNAATNPAMGAVLETTESVWDKIFEVNVKASFLLTKEVVPYMEKRGGGSIVLVSSVEGYTPSSVLGIYAVSKTSLFGLTKAMSSQLAEKNIRVNCLAPGLVQTKLSGALWQNKEILEGILAGQQMKRIGQPYEQAGAVAFLVSDDASYMTGETITVAGGVNSRL